MSKKSRMADFRGRFEDAPSELRTISCGRYVTVNPMGDELDLLSRLGMSPADCIKVDLYWEVRDDVRFVQIHTRIYNPRSDPGVYVRKSPSGYVNVVVVVDEPFITSSVVGRELERIRGFRVDRASLGGKLVSLGSPVVD